MDKFFNFMDKIIENYSIKHKVVSENFWAGEYELIYFLNRRYNKMGEIDELYKRIFISYNRNIITVCRFYANK